MMKITALDPGGTTGYAVGILDEQEGELKVKSGQQVWTHSELYAQLSISHPDIVVCESFEYRNRARSGLELISCELIGVVKLYCAQYKSTLVLQTAAKGKGYFNDAKLKEDNLYNIALPHANDALRHLLQWFTFESGYQFNKKGYVKL